MRCYFWLAACSLLLLTVFVDVVCRSLYVVVVCCAWLLVFNLLLLSVVCRVCLSSVAMGDCVSLFVVCCPLFAV